MSIVATRIDGRLIHGQVVNLWVPKLNISRIMVIDNETADSAVEKSALKLATPSGVKLSVLPVEKAANNILKGRYDSQRVLIVVKKPRYLVRLLELGVPIQEVNVGNMSQSDKTKSITKSINVTEEDIEDFKQLDQNGVKLFSQMVPSDNSQDFMSLLKVNQ